jgi:hypothetical protein
MFNEQMIALAAPAFLQSMWEGGDPPEDVQKECGELAKLVASFCGKIYKHNKEWDKASEKCTHDQYVALFEIMAKISSLCCRDGFVECEDLKKQILNIMNEGREKFDSVEDEYQKRYAGESPENE